LRKSLFVCLLTVGLMLQCVSEIQAAATVSTLASASISADTAGGAYTSLIGPVLDEVANQDIRIGTIVLNAPVGFAFDAASPVTVAVSRLAGTDANGEEVEQAAGQSAFLPKGNRRIDRRETGDCIGRPGTGAEDFPPG